VSTTLQQLAASRDARARGAAALIEAGFAAEVALEELTPGSVTRTLVDAFARELAKLHEQLGDVYESAFVDTATAESVAILVDRLCPRQKWWRRLFRRTR
jgi:uncharacterized protein with von Willebrand factor type A (vWA) domain